MLQFLANLETGVGIKEVINDVPILQRHLQSQGIVPVDHVVSQILDRVALLLVVHEGPIKIGIQQQIAQVVLSHQFRIFVSSEGLNLPAAGPVVSADGGHPLQRKSLAYQVRPLVLLRHLGRESSAPLELARHAH